MVLLSTDRCDQLGVELTRAAFTLAGKYPKALKAYEKAHAWRELFALAFEQKLSEDAVSGLVERVSGELAFLPQYCY